MVGPQGHKVALSKIFNDIWHGNQKESNHLKVYEIQYRGDIRGEAVSRERIQQALEGWEKGTFQEVGEPPIDTCCVS